MEKILHIVGGANGSGKSTVAQAIIQETGLPFLNPDLIAQEINPHAIDTVKIQAGKEYLKRLNHYFNHQQSFIIESTLAGKNVTKIIQHAHHHNYLVKISYTFLSHSNQCIDRIQHRVANGGHNVPLSDVVRRYYRSIINFEELYKNQVEEWNIFYNGFNYAPIMVATCKNNCCEICHPLLYRRFLKIFRYCKEHRP
ncbi:MAG: zeta toxin family protein [Bacteriovoracaceae bacterium]|nr:zeta toxin family protein [Bacteriovoracaceae bacterium]